MLTKWKVGSLVLLCLIGTCATIYIHKIRKEAVLEAATIVTKGDFSLDVSNVWDKNAEKPSAKLDWKDISNLTQKGYRMYQSEDGGSTWGSRSLNYGKKVSVLNIWPNLGTTGHYPEFPENASNAFKKWMDDLNLTDADGNKLIDVTPVSNNDFNANPLKYLKNADGTWKYNVVTLGTWDRNGMAKLQEKPAKYLMDFIEDGGGVLFGHDSIAADNSKVQEINEFMEPFAKKLGITYGFHNNGTPTSDSRYWRGSDKIKLINDGYLMTYPYEMKKEVVLTIPPAHNIELSVKDVGEVWFEFEPGGNFSMGELYDDNTLRNNWYLKTNENVAMIQTGHSNAKATIDESKIIANTLYNLAQVSIDSYADDQSVEDNQAPKKPTVEKKSGSFYDFTVGIESIDQGKDYQWYVEADSKDKGLLKSDTVKETITSNIAGYFYRIDDSETTNLAKEVEGFKDEFGRISKDKYDVYVAPSDSTESDYSTATEIKGLHGDKDADKYIHVVSVDRSNNVSEVSSVKVSELVGDGDFQLTAKNAWDKDAEKSYADLHWEEVQNLSQKGYQLFQSEDQSQNWTLKPINYGKQVKVLNVYPDISSSNTFKSWMDSLKLTANDGSKLIDVSPIKYSEFNKNPLNYLQDDQGNWKYDVLMFGSWDTNNNMSLNKESSEYVMDFINEGGGVLFGHDTIAGHGGPNGYYNRNIYMKPFAEKLGITYGFKSENWTSVASGSSTIKLINNGYLMKYPFELANNVELNIPNAHSIEPQIKDVGEVWFEFKNLTLYQTTVYDDGTNRGAWYLKTNENVAMIQTGHSNGKSTMDERKIIANTLYNLAQISVDEGAEEQTVVDDVKPENPKLDYNGGTFENFSLQLDAVDHGKPYQWYVEANTKKMGVLRSNIAEEEIKSNIAGYFYRIDSTKTSELKKEVESFKDSYGRIPKEKYDAYVAPTNSDAVTYGTKAEVTGLNGAEDANKYIHVVAVDRANNVSEVSSLQISELMTEFQVTETFHDEFGKELQPEHKVLIKKNENYVNPFPDIADYTKYGYQIDQSDIVEIATSGSGNVTIPNVVNNHEVQYLYTKPVVLHMRQVILSENGSVAVPDKGKVEVSNMKDEATNNSSVIKTNYEIKSGLENVGFSDNQFDKRFGYNFLYLKPYEPSFYSYEGAVVTDKNVPHNSADKVSGYPSLALAKGSEYWITFYLKPVVKTEVYLNVVNDRLSVYYSNIDHFTVYIEGEKYKDFTVTNKPTVESKVLDIPVSEIRNKLSVKYMNLAGESLTVYWNNTWDFVN